MNKYYAFNYTRYIDFKDNSFINNNKQLEEFRLQFYILINKRIIKNLNPEKKKLNQKMKQSFCLMNLMKKKKMKKKNN